MKTKDLYETAEDPALYDTSQPLPVFRPPTSLNYIKNEMRKSNTWRRNASNRSKLRVNNIRFKKKQIQKHLINTTWWRWNDRNENYWLAMVRRGLTGNPVWLNQERMKRNSPPPMCPMARYR